MATMDVFNQDPFNAIEMTTAVDQVPYVPNFLGSMPNLFVPRPVRTEAVMVENRDGVLSVIQTSERGEPLEQRKTEKRKARYFETVRIAKGDRINASEIQGIRAFGQESELMQVQDEVARRLGGPVGLRREVELTHEFHRLGAVQGIVYDADNTEIYNWFTEFGITPPAAINFELGSASTDVRSKCNGVIRLIMRGLKMGQVMGVQIYSLCSDTFFDTLIAHKSVRETWLNQEAAAELREPTAFRVLYFGGIVFVNYRGTDDESTVAIADGEAVFFPAVPGLFEVAFSPAETFEFVNTPGREVYSMIVPDRDRNAYVDVEVYSYPLFICTRPAALQKATAT